SLIPFKNHKRQPERNLRLRFDRDQLNSSLLPPSASRCDYRAHEQEALLPLQRVMRLDSEKAVRTRTGVRFILRVPDIFEPIHPAQFITLVVLVSVKSSVLIGIALKALEGVVIVGGVGMKMKPAVQQAR
ncbi:MAG: hypothetical protein ACM34H_01985, partial [Deltaproteobacteria bacterium]